MERLSDVRAGKAVPKDKNIIFCDVDGYSEDERRMMDDPMSIFNEFESLGDFKYQMQKLQDSVAGLRAQGRPLADLLKNWMFLGNPGTGKTHCTHRIQAVCNASYNSASSLVVSIDSVRPCSSCLSMSLR
jgi:DNA replication protein DnaC